MHADGTALIEAIERDQRKPGGSEAAVENAVAIDANGGDFGPAAGDRPAADDCAAVAVENHVHRRKHRGVCVGKRHLPAGAVGEIDISVAVESVEHESPAAGDLILIHAGRNDGYIRAVDVDRHFAELVVDVAEIGEHDYAAVVVVNAVVEVAEVDIERAVDVEPGEGSMIVGIAGLLAEAGDDDFSVGLNRDGVGEIGVAEIHVRHAGPKHAGGAEGGIKSGSVAEGFEYEDRAAEVAGDEDRSTGTDGDCVGGFGVLQVEDRHAVFKGVAETAVRESGVGQPDDQHIARIGIGIGEVDRPGRDDVAGRVDRDALEFGEIADRDGVDAAGREGSVERAVGIEARDDRLLRPAEIARAGDDDLVVGLNRQIEGDIKC